MVRSWVGCLTLVLVVGNPALAQTENQDSIWPFVSETGTFFLAGERLDAPYVLSFDGDTLRINGQPLKPLRRTRCSGIVVADEIEERHVLLSGCMSLSEALLDQGLTRQAIRDSVLLVLESHRLIDETGIHAEGSLYLRWREGPAWKEFVLIPSEKLPPSPPWNEVCRTTAEQYVSFLDRQDIVIVGAGGEIILGPEREEEFQRELEALYRSRNPDSDTSGILTRLQAREFLRARGQAKDMR